MSNGETDRDLVGILQETAEGVAQLQEHGLWEEVARRAWDQDVAGLAQLFDRFGFGRRCSLVCSYLCVKRCGLVCLRLCGSPDPQLEPSSKTLQEFAKVVGRIGSDDKILVPLVSAIETQNQDEFKRVVDKFKLQRFCHLLCYWICSIQCRLYCRLVCEPGQIAVTPDLVSEVREASQAVAQLASKRGALTALYKAYESKDIERAQAVIAEAELSQICIHLCHFLCVWECFWICLRLCLKFPIEAPDDPIKEIQEFGRVTASLASTGALEKLTKAVVAGDTKGFTELVKELRLHPFCHQICRWICVCRCRLYCRLVCPPICEIIEPDGCVEEETFHNPLIFRGVEIRGTATGIFCDYYTLEWRQGGAAVWRSDYIHYAGPNPNQGTCGVVNGALGYLETFPAVEEGPVEIRLCVYSKQENVPPCCYTIVFELARNLVWISSVEGVAVDTPPGVFDPNAQLVDASGDVRSFGTRLHVWGTAWVGGCSHRKLKRYTLSYHPDFVVNPNLPGFVEFWQVDFTVNGFQEAYRDTNPVHEDSLTRIWRRFQVCLPLCFTISNYLSPRRWDTRTPNLHHVEPVDPPATPNPATWTSKELPLPNCQSGKYTLRLSVEDTSGIVKHDLQQVWFDNKTLGPAHATISQIAGVKVCDVINLSQFAPAGASCGRPWEAQLLGIAYDDYIEEGNAAPPSDNFGGYELHVKKDGAPNPGEPIPIPGPTGWPAGGPFVGTSRVGTPDPLGRCQNPDPPIVYPAEADGILAVLDMRRFSDVCNPTEPKLTLKTGECCDYLITLHVWDTSICPSLSNDRHERWHSFPLRICNDLG